MNKINDISNSYFKNKLKKTKNNQIFKYYIYIMRRCIMIARSAKNNHIFVAYAECGTKGDLDRVIEAAGAERLPGTHCYAFFSGVDAFAARDDDITSFFLTDFLVRQFDSLIMKGLGIAKHPELRDMYFGNYKKVVYISQIATPDLIAKAELAADKLGLAFEHRPVGYGDLAISLDERFPV